MATKKQTVVKKSANKKLTTTNRTIKSKPAVKRMTKKSKSLEKKVVPKKQTTPKRTVTINPTVVKPTVKMVAKVVQRPTRTSTVLTNEEINFLKLHQTLKLQIELVPASFWWSNVRSNVTDKQWDNIRKRVYIKANYTCEICGEKGTNHPVECHEVWIYDDTNLLQRLGHFQALCPLCHEVKHIGLAGIRGNEDRAFNRFKTINQLDDNVARQIISAVFKQWRIRSGKQWKLDIEHLKEYGLNPNELKDKRERCE
jgi:hypothetical protein